MSQVASLSRHASFLVQICRRSRVGQCWPANARNGPKGKEEKNWFGQVATWRGRDLGIRNSGSVLLDVVDIVKEYSSKVYDVILKRRETVEAGSCNVSVPGLSSCAVCRVVVSQSVCACGRINI